MAGCVSCFIIPLLLFLFHRFIQPIILKFWNPWEDKTVKAAPNTTAPQETQPLGGDVPQTLTTNIETKKEI